MSELPRFTVNQLLAGYKTYTTSVAIIDSFLSDMLRKYKDGFVIMPDPELATMEEIKEALEMCRAVLSDAELFPEQDDKLMAYCKVNDVLNKGIKL